MAIRPVELSLDLQACDAFAVAAPGLAAIFYADRLEPEHVEMLRPHLAVAIDREADNAIGVVVPAGAAPAMRHVLAEDLFEELDLERPHLPFALKNLLRR